MESVSAQMVAAAKLLVLNPGEFELWKIRIKQYFLMMDYALWKVRVNGDSPPPMRTIDGVEQTYHLTTAEEKLARKNELKSRVYGCIDDLNMPNLEEIVYSDDDEDVGAEADMSNLDTNIPVGPILTTKIHKDHPVEQIIRDIHLAPQTRRMTKNVTNHGYTQEEGIDYDEVFAPVANIDEIRLFLAYASFRDFVVYQMDVKSAFLYGKIEEEVYVCQPLGFEDPEFSNRVYKVEKALYKFGFSTVKTTSTPMETLKPLIKDENTKDVDVHLYRSMIGSLMYLTPSRPDIIFVVLWIQNQMLDYGYNFKNTKILIDNESIICIVKNPVFHSKTKHIKIRHHFIKDSYEK
nr:retrovirus-related Pol polyprotein from transposon TNT 1-94 [Tanacetum cinerariifolium]